MKLNPFWASFQVANAGTLKVLFPELKNHVSSSERIILVRYQKGIGNETINAFYHANGDIFAVEHAKNR
jgi:hypothetical protein